jgi:hypothetical protein
MRSFLGRLMEPSTYAGIASCLAGCGLLGLTRDEWDQILGMFIAFLGAAAVFLKERPRAASGSDDDREAGVRCVGCGRPFARAKTQL